MGNQNQFKTNQYSLLLDLPTIRLSQTQQRMYSLNIMLHGADTAKSLLQSGLNLLSTLLELMILLLPALMPLKTILEIFQFQDIQLFTGSQRKVLQRNTEVEETLMPFLTSSARNHLLLRPTTSTRNMTSFD